MDTDAALESMTTSLLQVSTVFLVQQNELAAVRDRLAKELARVDAIQEALTSAAQQHQDAVLSVIQNYETLACAHEEAMAQGRAAAGGDAAALSRLSTSSMASEMSDARHSSAFTATPGLTPSPPRPSLGTGCAARLRSPLPARLLSRGCTAPINPSPP